MIRGINRYYFKRIIINTILLVYLSTETNKIIKKNKIAAHVIEHDIKF